MILKVEMQNFMGTNRTVTLRTDTLLSGKNGSHKTTVLHAIAFVLCGTDAWGTAAPIFMISNGTDKMGVIVTTTKTTIQRTLTRKKTASLNIKLNDVWTTINQTQMNDFVGPKQHVLAVLNPQYFFSLSHENQKQLIASVLPTEDRVELVSELIGEPVNDFDAEIIRTKEPLRAATVFAEERRRVEREKAYLEGNSQRIKEDLEKAKAQLESSKFAPATMDKEFNLLDIEKKTYERDLYSYQQCLTLYESNTKQKDSRVAALSELIKSNSEMVPVLEAQLIEADQEIKTLGLRQAEAESLVAETRKNVESNQKEAPQKPAALSLPTGDFCGSCGQAVSKRYKQKVSDDLQATQEEYRVAVEKFNQERVAINSAHENAEANLRRIQADLSKLELYKFQIQTNMSQMQEKIKLCESDILRLQETGGERPVPPEKNYSEDRWEELKKALEVLQPHSKKLELEGTVQGAELSLGLRRAEMNKLELVIESKQKIEEACKLVPQREIERMKNHLKIKDYQVDLETKGLLISEGGVPYVSMSAGQKMCAEISLALHINSLCRKINLMFLDNFELVDATNANEIRNKLFAEGVQIIQTKVTDGELKEEWS